MKASRINTHRKSRALPALRFEQQRLTSFAGLLLFQKLFAALRLRDRLHACFAHLGVAPIFGHHVVVLALVVHLLLGYRELRDVRFYRDDPMVKRILGLRRLPDVATISRVLASVDARAVERLRALCRKLCLDRLQALGVARITLDFDGSVLSTMRKAEGTAVGYNRKRRGARSYFPLFCTIAQTGQILDVLHRPGNAHDSRGAGEFILDCLGAVRRALPGVRIEARLDAAFFSDEIVSILAENDVAFSVSVPFDRLPELKARIEKRRRWIGVNDDVAVFEERWKPKAWAAPYRFVFVRQRRHFADKGPVQLDLFVPYETGHEFRVIVTNKTTNAPSVIAFHHGRGSQEAVFGDLKGDCHMDYVAVRRLHGNQTYLLAALLAHNLNRELQMITRAPERNTTPKRSALWAFQTLATVRRTLVQRAGRLTRPNGRLTLTMSANHDVQRDILALLAALPDAA
jgi:Transposase DDE domain group 1